MSESEDADGDTATLLNAVVGAIVGVVLSFIPLSPIIGGAVAGYLEGGSGEQGLKVGALAGFIMLIPLLLFAMFFTVVLIGIAAEGVAFALIGLFFVIFIMAYTLGLSVLGGYLGVYLKNEM